MNLEEILQKYSEDGWIDDYWVDSPLTEVLQAMKEFGKQCFNAARKIECTTTGDVDDIPGVVYSNKFSNFEDYLKSLDNESNSRD